MKPSWADRVKKSRGLESFKRQIKTHEMAIRAACGHKTHVVYLATGECYECHCRALWEQPKQGE